MARAATKKFAADWFKTVDDHTKSLLIEAVQPMPYLWNPKHPQHKNATVTENGWRRVTDDLQLESVEAASAAKSMWQRLRSGYRAEKSRLMKKKSGMGAADLPSPKWIFFNSMRFVDEADSVFEAFDNESLETLGETQPPGDADSDKPYLEEGDENYDPNLERDWGSVVSGPGAIPQQPHPDSGRKTRKRRQSAEEEGWDKVQGAVLGTLQSVQMQENNDNYHFAMSLFHNLELLPRNKAIRIRHQINVVMDEALMAEFDK